MKKLYAFVLVGLISCTSEDPVPKENEKFSISGKVRGAEGYKVFVNYGAKSATTDSVGNYTIRDLEKKNYTIVPSKEGFVFSPKETVVTILDSNVDFVDFVMKPSNQIQYDGLTWDLLGPEYYFIRKNEGTVIQLDLQKNGAWTHFSSAGMIYQETYKDFSITTVVTIGKKSDNSVVPACKNCFAGLVLKRLHDEVGIQLAFGKTEEGIGVKVETSLATAFEVESSQEITSIALRISRVGDNFFFYKKGLEESEWQLIFVDSNRTDLNNFLNAGFGVYSADSGELADITAIFEGVSIVQ